VGFSWAILVAGTAEMLWEVAAGAMVGAVCGLHQHGVGATCGTRQNQTSGLEARFQAQVAYATLGKTRQEVNELILACLENYKNSLKSPNLGKSFSELVNTDTLEPAEEWLDIYQKVKGGLSRMGLDLDNAWKKARRTKQVADR